MTKIVSIFSRHTWLWLRRCAANKHRTVLFVGLLAFFSCAFAGLERGLPLAHIHDEFSYLLAADTFASGRLTNPPHPLWKHFESMHVLQKPTYMSRYPPMQGLFLCMGEKFFGSPIMGVWLSIALMSAAICWMIQAWGSPRWALIASMIVIFHPAMGAISYWAQSYWGGAVAAMGGAMVLGGIRRLSREVNIFDTLMMGVGTAVLVNSRPFESSIIILPVLALIIYWAFKKHSEAKRIFIGHVLVPLLIMGLLVVIAMGYYNKTITGNAWTMPYVAYEQAYSSAPAFIWQEERQEPIFNNEQMKEFNKEENETHYFQYAKQESYLASVCERFFTVILPGITANNLLIFPFLLGCFSLVYGNKWIVFAGLMAYLYVLMQSTLIWFNFHYMAPLAACFVVLIVQGLRILYSFKVKKVSIGKVLIIFYLASIIYLGYDQMRHPADQFIWTRSNQAMNLRVVRGYAWYMQRQEIIDFLNSLGGKHLILVKYESRLHSVHNEWVYNQADIDKSSIVWARDLGAPSNQEMFKYFKGRMLWILTINKGDSIKASFYKENVL